MALCDIHDAMGRSCILDSHPGRWMPAAVRMLAVVLFIAEG